MKKILCLLLIAGCNHETVDVSARIRLNVIERKLAELDDCLTDKMMLAGSDLGTRIGIQTCLAIFRRTR